MTPAPARIAASVASAESAAPLRSATSYPSARNRSSIADSCSSPRRSNSSNPRSRACGGRSSPRALCRSSWVSCWQARKLATSLADTRSRPSIIFIALRPPPRRAGPAPSRAISPDLVDVFEEYPLVEAATFVPLAGRFRDDILPAHALSSGQRLQNFQHVRQFRPQPPIRRRLRFLGLLDQFRP